MDKKIVVASGYFAPLHSGHIEYLTKSKALGDILIVIVNNDKQLENKHGHVFMSCKERVKVLRALSCVDMAVEAVDSDRSVCETLRILHPHIFSNGGDQFNKNVPEEAICKKMGILMVDGLGDKIQSSSALIKTVKNSEYK